MVKLGISVANQINFPLKTEKQLYIFFQNEQRNIPVMKSKAVFITESVHWLSSVLAVPVITIKDSRR